MRELTKSMLSMSWALPSFGLQQMLNVTRPDRAAAAFDAVTRSTLDQLGDTAKSTFQAGDQIQRGMVDVAFAFLDPRFFDPGRWAEWSADVVRRSTNAVGSSIPGCDDRGGSSGSGGWGPVPPPNSDP